MSDALLWNEIGNVYLRIGSPKEAIAAYIKAIELKPDSGMPYYHLGHAYFLTGDFGKALFLFRKSVQLMDSPENQAMVWNRIGDTYRALKDIEHAIQAYKSADDLDMTASPVGNHNSSQTAVKKNQADDSHLEKKIPAGEEIPVRPQELAPANTVSIMNPPENKGLQPINSRKNGQEYSQPAECPMQPVVNVSIPVRKSSPVGPAVNSGSHQESHHLVVKTENAVVSKEKSIIVFPASDETDESLPMEATPQQASEKPANPGNGRKPDETRPRKPTQNSNNYPVVDNLEEILAKVNIYEKITRVNPINDRAWDTLGKLYKSLGRYPDAVAAYKKAIEIAPEREVYYYYLGLLYSVEQQNDDAVQAFLIVLRKNPDYILAHSALAGVYHRMGLENKANHHIATALPKMNNESAYNRACFYAICGEKELAFEFLRLALKNQDTTIEWIKSDPDLDPIRSDQRYQEMISEKDQSAADSPTDNYFGSELDGKQNNLLPILNRSLAR
jgi:tetratricopeptide (TPR) repeat protein